MPARALPAPTAHNNGLHFFSAEICDVDRDNPQRAENKRGTGI